MNLRRIPAQVIRALALLFIPGSLFAQGAIIPSSPAEWQVSGGTAKGGEGQATVLSPGTVLTRTFPADAAAVRVVSRPYFSASPAGQPSLEVGPAALTFLRDKEGGAMILLGNQPLSLPVSIPLAEDGYSLETLDFTFGYNLSSTSAKLVWGERAYSLAAAGSGGPITIVVSAGEAAPWRLDALEVRLSPSGAETESFTDQNSQRLLFDPSGDAALTLRQSLVRAVLAKEESADEAVRRLKRYLTSEEPTFESDEAFIIAAIDLGQRLIGAGQAALAEPFFRAAEEGLDALLSRPADASDHAKAQLLQQRALVRSQYLGKPAQAAVDLEAAIQLRPANTYLQTMRDRLAAERSEKTEQNHKGGN